METTLINSQTAHDSISSSRNAQGAWWEMLSASQVLTQKHQSNNNNQLPQQQQMNETIQKKKKKCYGNRKEQRSRRKMRRQQQQHMNEMAMIDGMNQQKQDQQHVAKPQTKRKRQDVNKDDVNVTRSFSQLSISQPTKKGKTATDSKKNPVNNELVEDNNHLPCHQEQEQITGSNTMNDLQKLKPQYLNVSDRLFKQFLSKSIENGNQLVQALDTVEKIEFVRHMTETTNNLYYFDLQRHLWQDYATLAMHDENNWPKRVSKSFAKQHHLGRHYGIAKHTIEQRQKTIQYQLDRTIKELQEYLLKVSQYAQIWEPRFDENLLSTAINECVKQGQQKLRKQFEYRRKILALDAKDHYLLKQFYDLKPTQEQVCFMI